MYLRSGRRELDLGLNSGSRVLKIDMSFDLLGNWPGFVYGWPDSSSCSSSALELRYLAKHRCTAAVRGSVGAFKIERCLARFRMNVVIQYLSLDPRNEATQA